ncbi:hypothetical protein BSKO_09633 [Bryopsis sp. KO-2023]|nr:hypothetical protein BSKO_09633 [Bryopsis sp. KO-2023]
MSDYRRKRTRKVFTMELLEEEFLDQVEFDHKISRSRRTNEAANSDDSPTVMSFSSGGTASPLRRRGGGWDGGSHYDSFTDQPFHDAKIPYSSGNRTHRRVSSTHTTRRVFVVPPSRQMKRTRRNPSRNFGALSPATAASAHRDGVHLSKLNWCVKQRDLVTPPKSDLQGKRLSADPHRRCTLLTGSLAFLFPERKLQEIDRIERSRRGNIPFPPALPIEDESPPRNAPNGIPSERKGNARRDGTPRFTWLSQSQVVKRLDWVSRGEDLEGFRLGGKLKGEKLGHSGFWEVDTIKDDFTEALGC